MKLSEVIDNEKTIIYFGQGVNEEELNSYIMWDKTINVRDDCYVTEIYKKYPDLVKKLKFGRIGGNYVFKDANATDIEFGPLEVDGYYDITYNSISTLKYVPRKVGTSFNCDHNLLTSYVGCPEVAEDMYFNNNKITSLVGIHKSIHRCKTISFDNNHIKEGGIGLIFIKDLESIRSNNRGFDEAVDIIKKYLGQGKASLLECQEELEEAGLSEFAKL